MKQKVQLVMSEAEPFFFPGNRIGCLLVHGFTGTPKEMRLLGEHLHKTGFSVLGIRLAGHATKPEDMVRSCWQDWLLSVEDGFHLLKQSCDEIVIIGLSMGGMLAQIAASLYPASAAVIISTPYHLPQDWRLRFIDILKFFIPAVEKEGEGDWNDPENSLGHKSYSQYPCASIAELVKVVDEMHNRAASVLVPVLLVQSTSDATVPEEHARLHFNDLGTTDKEILIVHRSGHVITEDTDREIVFESIVSFIQRVSKSK